jgi:hypothetical protein
MEPIHRLAAGEAASEPPPRRRMPTERRSLTHKFCVDGHEGYLTAGLYDDGTVGELFITGNASRRRTASDATLPPSGPWRRTR